MAGQVRRPRARFFAPLTHGKDFCMIRNTMISRTAILCASGGADARQGRGASRIACPPSARRVPADARFSHGSDGGDGTEENREESE
jgi:hypothetical protein